MLRPDRAGEEKALRDLEREAEALAALAHPMLVRGFDAVLDGPRPHLLIEHLEGPSLRRLIRRDGAIPLQQLLPLAVNVAGALQYMAQSGYVHLDVKPDNIIMGVPPRLIDLSIARTVERAARTRRADRHRRLHGAGAVPGRVGGRPIGPAADSWGLGATLHHAISGEKPFPEAAARARSASRSCARRRRRSPTTPTPLRELILDLLDRDPRARPSCAEAVERLRAAGRRAAAQDALGKQGRSAADGA